MTIATETRILIQAALEGDPALTSLAVAGSTPDTLSVHIAHGTPTKSISDSTYDPEPPFRREILTELIVRLQRLRWRRVDSLTDLLEPPEERLIVRLQRLRWRRVDSLTDLLEPPEEIDLQALRAKHARAVVPFECWPGWTDLFDTMFAWLHAIAPEREWAPTQIKEKYGTLRFYWHGNLPPFGDEIIEVAEHISGHLCEICGAPGRLQSQHGWWSTRCPEHKNWSSS